MRISLSHFVVGGLGIVAVGLILLRPWVIVLGAAGAALAATGVLLRSGRGSQRPGAPAEAGRSSITIND